MEEEKAAAYYEELTRKGEGAARFKQGLGFSDDAHPPKIGSALPSSASFLSNFVKASSPTKSSEFEKQAQLQCIQNKLKKKSNAQDIKTSRASERFLGERDEDGDSRRRGRSRERYIGRDEHGDSRRRSSSRGRYGSSERGSRRRSRSRERYRERDMDKVRERRRRKRSRSRNDKDGERRQRERSRSRSFSPRRRRSRSRSLSPREQRRSEKNYSHGGDRRKLEKLGKEKNAGVDYARLIEGYDKMAPAERVKAKMKLQLSETAKKDAAEGMGPGWERFEFNKDAPLDDEEIEAVEDDAALVKHIGQSFRFSMVKARREEQIKAAHDEAMFGAPALTPSVETDSEAERESNEQETNKKHIVASLLNETVLTKQKGSWRDRVREL